MRENTISIVITTYGRSELIRKAVLNVLDQTISNEFDIVVVDDNGLNTHEQINTLNKLEEFIEGEIIHYYPLNKNYGASFARNFGAKKSKGKFIAFFDDDDYWDNTKIEKQLKIMEANQEIGFVYCLQKSIHYKTGKTLYISKQGYNTGYIFHELLRLDKGSISTPNPLININTFWEVGGFNNNLPARNDIDLFLRITEKFQVEFVPEFLHFTVEHNNERISKCYKNVITGYNHLLKRYSGKMHIDTLRYIHSRIIFQCFYAKEKTQCLESIEFIKNNDFMTMKLVFTIIGINNIIVRMFIIMYLRIKIYLRLTVF